MLGDSFVFGSCVNDNDSISGILRKLSDNKKSVLNLSYDGHGPLMQIAAMKEYSKKLSINNILWFYYEGNDLHDLIKELKDPMLSKYIKEYNFDQNLILKQNEINNLSLDMMFKVPKKKITYRINDRTKFLKLHNLRKLTKNIFKKRNSINYPLKEFEEILKIAKNFANKNNSNIFFIYLPSLENFNRKKIQRDIENEIKILVKKAKIPLIDVKKLVFSNKKNPKSLFPFNGKKGHYNELGYSLVSKSIYKFIEDY